MYAEIERLENKVKSKDTEIERLRALNATDHNFYKEDIELLRAELRGMTKQRDEQVRRKRVGRPAVRRATLEEVAKRSDAMGWGVGQQIRDMAEELDDG